MSNAGVKRSLALPWPYAFGPAIFRQIPERGSLEFFAGPDGWQFHMHLTDVVVFFLDDGVLRAE